MSHSNLELNININAILHSMPLHINKDLASKYLSDPYKNSDHPDSFCNRLQLDFDKTLDLAYVIDFLGEGYEVDKKKLVTHLQKITKIPH